MLLVKTIVKKSKIHGLGLFADEFIPKGTKVWQFTPGFDQKFTREQVLNFPDLVQIFLYKYTHHSRKSSQYILCSDYGNFFNHSDDPNCLSGYEDGQEEVVTYATKDIQLGEEMTDNYSSFEEVHDEDNILEEIAQKFKLGDELDPRLKEPRL